MRVFLTGGTGLVGSHVAEQLRARGDHVRSLARDGSDARHLVSIGSEIIRGDVAGEGDALADAMRGCDALVHAAALVGARATRDRYVGMNVDGTRRVMEAASRSSVRRVVHVSSVAVYGPIDGAITEERWREVPIHEQAFYAWSKRASEVEAWRHHEAGTLQVTTVRPALIFGERDRHVSPRLDRAMRMPLLPLPDAGRHVLPLVYAGNVAAGIIAALDRPAASGRAYNLARDNDVVLRDVVRTWATARRGTVPRIINVPGAAVEAAVRAIDGLSHRLPGPDLPGLTRPARLVRRDNPYVSDRARAELDWTGLVPMHEAIRRTVAWIDATRATE